MANETPRDQQAVFAVPMTCEGCVKDVSDSLYKIAGISKVEANLKEQLVRVEGTGMDFDRLWCLVFAPRDTPCRNDSPGWADTGEDPGDWRERVPLNGC